MSKKHLLWYFLMAFRLCELNSMLTVISIKIRSQLSIQYIFDSSTLCGIRGCRVIKNVKL